MKSNIAFVGCRTTKERKARGEGISTYTINPDNNWHLLHIYKNLVNPSYLVLDNSQEYLYCVHGDYSELTAFKILEDNSLSILNTLELKGDNPVHLAISEDNRFLVVAFLQTGNIFSVERSLETGKLLKVVSEYTVAGIKKDTVSHPHQITFDSKMNRILVPCQGRKAGISKIVILNFNKQTGALSYCFERATKENAEARHVSFHSNGKFIYGVNEMANTLVYYVYDEVTGALIPMQSLSTLPSGESEGWASGISLSNKTNTVYVSNRKHNSVSWYKLNRVTGFLNYVDNLACLGEQPRFITLDPDEHFLYVANELTDTIVRYKLDGSGNLSLPELVVETGSPVCIAFKNNDKF